MMRDASVRRTSVRSSRNWVLSSSRDLTVAGRDLTSAQPPRMSVRRASRFSSAEGVVEFSVFIGSFTGFTGLMDYWIAGVMRGRNGKMDQRRFRMSRRERAIARSWVLGGMGMMGDV